MHMEDGGMDLRDKVIVITGASSGFGEAIARGCADAGATVVLAARSAEKLDQLAGELGAATGRALAVPTDVSSTADVERLAALTLERFGRADVLINNAGFGVLDRFADAQIADLQEMIDVNLYGATRCTQAFLPDMLRRRSGQIVIMASLAGLMASLNMAFYAATKFALVGVAQTLMLELAGSGVKCALICPGVAMTGFQSRADVRKYSRITSIVRVSTAQVAQATVRAIARGTNGEVLIPWHVRPLLTFSSAFPSLARAVMRIVH
jgi:short-subunit dehydrogenase